jgi:putative phosphoribosyl transferase
MVFRNREEAGEMLAKRLRAYANREDVIVLGIPRGGVSVAFEVATALQAPLDIFVLRKLGVPGHKELAFGAIASGGSLVLDRRVIEGLDISDRQIEVVIANERMELERRELAYRDDKPPLEIEGLIAIVVDDGIATGSSMRAGIRALRQLKPARIVVAVPVAPLETCNRLRPEVDELVCVHRPQSFLAIGQFYKDFSQVSDQEVIELLKQADRHAVPKVR